ncbi:MAG TPA: RMD1 family protein [Mariprofundaceae bacterium]|nr:RMD1 family protein [Mariprofundaceae bacterium]
MPFEQQEKISARALYVGQRLELRAFERAQRLATSPLMVSAGSQGAAVLFRYGAVVLFGLTAVEEVTFLKELEPFILQPLSNSESESSELRLGDKEADSVSGNGIVLANFELSRLQIVADVLAKSAILSYYESTLAQIFERIEPLANNLQQGGRLSHQSRKLLEHIGDVLSIQGKMVGRVEVAEKPELLWDAPQYERLYARLADEYELVERHRALERKLEMISKTAETLLDLLQNKRSLRVEWYIVILIVVEILLTVYEMWRRGGHL